MYRMYGTRQATALTFIGRIPQEATRGLKAWLIVASFEAYRYIVQETEVVLHGREMAALTWL